ncbi:MAG: AAA family ATPase [Chloroflexi bacterium]|nr:AAA family ATPase [Chloroflexota bacterium]
MRCANCGTTWPDDLQGVMKFCGACGAALLGQAAPSTPLIQTYVAHNVTTAPGGELRYVTVLFADLVGYTAFAEDRPPDEVSRVVGDLFQNLGRDIEQFNGGIYQFLGDGVIGTFGLPRPDPGAARNAVRAGLAMQATLQDYVKETGLPFQLRVGVHAGDVMFRALSGSWTIMGDTVNTARRIEDAAPHGKVWISRPVYEETHRYFSIIPRPAIELKGKRESVQPYEVVAERLTPALELPTFVGREAEWARLQGELQTCLSERSPRVVILRGPAGVGKSRLVWELRDWVQRQPEIYRVDVAQYDHSERLPSHGLNTLIRSRFDLPLALSEAETLERLEAALPEQYPHLEPKRRALAAEFLAFVLGIGGMGQQIHSLDGRGKWEGAFIEVKNWMEGITRGEPWIWFLEDVQKGDADTAAFIDWVLGVEWHGPLFVVVTLREEDFDAESYWHEPVTRWGTEGKADEIRLTEIEPRKLAKALIDMASGEISTATAERIAEHTEGNPLFATEVILFLRDQGLLNDEMAVEKLTLPGSAREVMEARLERLGQNGKEVAKRGALVGRRFTSEAVERIWEKPRADLENGLVVLRETETVFEEASKLFVGEIEQVFRHGRLQEAALARIPRADRLAWLSGLENWACSKLLNLGENWQAAGIQLIPVIARSLEEHGKNFEASLWYEVLGLLHRRQNRARESALALQKALGLAQGVQKLALARLAAETLNFNGEPEKALALLDGLRKTTEIRTPELPDEAAARRQSLTANPLEDWPRLPRREAELAVRLARCEALNALGRAAEAGREFAALEADLEDANSLAGSVLWLRWGRQYAHALSELLADPAAAPPVYERVRARVDVRQTGLADELLQFVMGEAMAASRLGHYDEAKELTDQSLALARAGGDALAESRSLNHVGIIATGRGDIRASTEAYGRALVISQAIGYRHGEVVALHNLGITSMDQGDLDSAAQCQQQYFSLSLVTGNKPAQAYAPAYLGMIAIEKGEFEHAAELLEEAAQVAEQNGWKRVVGLVRGFEGLLALRRWLAERDAAWLAKAIDGLLKTENDWKLVDEAGEIYANLILALRADDRLEDARAALERGRASVDPSWAAARAWLDACEAALTGGDLRPMLKWFRKGGNERAAGFLKQFSKA